MTPTGVPLRARAPTGRSGTDSTGPATTELDRALGPSAGPTGGAGAGGAPAGTRAWPRPACGVVPVRWLISPALAGTSPATVLASGRGRTTGAAGAACRPETPLSVSGTLRSAVVRERRAVPPARV